MNKLILFLSIALSLSFLSFKDNQIHKYKDAGNNLIQRSDGAVYQKGIINLKFKEHNNSFSSLKFGISKLDNVISEFGVTKVYQRYPLKKDVSKRMIGDDDISKIFTFYYSNNIDPTELSKLIYDLNQDIIEWIEPDFVYQEDFIPNDPSVNLQYHISKINSYQAWDLSQGDTSIYVGLVDSGSDFDHPDLSSNIKYNYSDPINGIDDDANGYVDDFKGWDFGMGDNDPQIYYTANDHGSHVSGCASQVTNNGVHGAGIGFKVKLRISKHSVDNVPSSIYNSNDGIVYCYQNGAKIINCSFGSSTYSSYTQNIVTAAWNAGSVICASAGNEGLNIPRYPASYDNVVSVAATNSTDLKASFSNYHSSVDVSAPGDNILSTVYDNSYAAFSGTSMSSPVTSGTVALIRSKYPSWTPQQVVDRLLLGVDSIYHLNPSYVGMLGTGRINAFKCLSEKPIVSILSYTHNDSVYGNNDKVYDIGEKIPILLDYKNVWIAGSNISLRLTTTDPDVEIVKDSVFVGNLAAYSTYRTSITNTFEVRAKSSCPFDKTVTFKLSNSSSCYTMDNSNTIVITFRQGWVTHTVNNLRLSLTKDGAVGKKSQAYGNGLFLASSPSVNQILEGGLMIGTSNTKVSDVCRRGSAPVNMSDTDFTALATYVLTTPGSLSNQDGNGLFNDNGAGSNKIGVTVRAQSYAWSGSQDANYIILKYTIKNSSGSSISNMFAGIYEYFTPSGVASNNYTMLDTLNRLGYSYNAGNNNPHMGIAILTGQNLNFKAVNGTDVLNGFTTQEKWDALSSGISVPSLGPGINCMVISAGPISLGPNDSTVVGFAVVTGSTLAELRTNTAKAKEKYNSVIGIEPISGRIPAKFELYQNYPNPFNPETNLQFDIPRNEFVTLKVYDITGREVAVLLNSRLEAGSYKVVFDAANYSSGVYFYRIETGSNVDVKKMILLK